MASVSAHSPPLERLTIRNLETTRDVPDLAADVRGGLSSTRKRLPPKYFYDKRGSWLFEQICETPEYYPTRLEDSLLARYASQIIDLVRPETILEFGSGSSRKTVHLLEACDALGCYCRYQPLDVCGEMLLDAGQRLVNRHDWLTIDAMVGDYCSGLKSVPTSNGPRLFLFLGGTLGNFNECEAEQFLRDLRAVMRNQDWFFLGADRVKDIKVLNAAYNDAQGYTAAFNLNVLEVINRELGAEFDLGAFIHLAEFNNAESCIEMHLQSKKRQSVYIRDLDMVVTFDDKETILTEISRKFTRRSLTLLLQVSGFSIERHYAPDNDYYSLLLARPVVMR